MPTLHHRYWTPLCHLQFLALLVIYTYMGLSPSPGGDLLPAYNDKLMHFFGYLVAGISISLAWPQWHYRTRWLLMVSYSIAIEIGQHFMPPRTFEWGDILANVAGVTLGLLAYAALHRTCRHLSRCKPEL